MTFIDLYISPVMERPQVKVFVHANAEVVIDFLFQIICDNKIQQILQERKMHLWQLTYLQALVFEIETN